MSFEKVSVFLKEKGFSDRIKVFDHKSTATVALAAEALGVSEGEIAKTMSFLMCDGAIVIVLAGDKKISNQKFKATFHTKAKMVPFSDVERLIGHEVGGVCPFCINNGVKIYLDKSLCEYDFVYPAAGSINSTVKLTPDELFDLIKSEDFVDVSA